MAPIRNKKWTQHRTKRRQKDDPISPAEHMQKLLDRRVQLVEKIREECDRRNQIDKDKEAMGTEIEKLVKVGMKKNAKQVKEKRKEKGNLSAQGSRANKEIENMEMEMEKVDMELKLMKASVTIEKLQQRAEFAEAQVEFLTAENIQLNYQTKMMNKGNQQQAEEEFDDYACMYEDHGPVVVAQPTVHKQVAPNEDHVSIPQIDFDVDQFFSKELSSLMV